MVLAGAQQRRGGQTAPNPPRFVRAFAHKGVECEHHPRESQRIPLKLYRRDKRKTRYTRGVTGFILVPLVGIELTTYRLQGGCSTN
jgi:hypothetical protein